MQGTALSVLLTMLKAEVGYSLDATATGKDAALIQLLANKQNWLASEYDFPFLKDTWDLVCAPSSRYLAIPTIDKFEATQSINFERPLKVELHWGNYWNELDYGVGVEQYNAIDSDAGTTMDPIQRYEFFEDLSGQVATRKVEVWPMPGTQQTLRFSGQRALRALASANDVADLDDLLLVLFVAADIVAPEEKQMKLGAAQERLRRLLGSYSQETQSIVFGKRFSGGEQKRQKVVPVIAVHG